MFNFGRLNNYFARNREIFNRGVQYYKKGLVKNVEFLSGSQLNIIRAKIAGSKVYETEIKFDTNLEYYDHKCSCPYYKEYMRLPCKHVAALYMMINNNKEFERSINFLAGKELLEEFMDRMEMPHKNVVRLEITLGAETSYSGVEHFYISFKVGEDKFYVVKNIKEFFDTIEYGKIIEFGKNFTFNPMIHGFEKEDRLLIKYLKRVYWADSIFREENLINAKQVFSGNKVKLNESMFIEILRLIGNRSFKFVYNGMAYYDVRVDFENVPFEVKINENIDSVVAEVIYKGSCALIGKNRMIVFDYKKLYVLDNKSKLYKFIDISKKRKTRVIEFKGELKNRFLSLVPHLEEKNIEVDEAIVNRFVKDELKPKLYFSKDKNGLKLRAEFCYGQEKVNPFIEEDNPFILRDFYSEDEVLNLIKMAGFKIKDQVALLDDYDDIYTFFKDYLPILHTKAEIYLTDDVKNMFLSRFKYRSTVKSSMNGVIELDFDVEGIDEKEIKNLLISIKEKKKYHKLKNGNIISLEDEEAKEILDFIEKIDEDEIADKKVYLSKYRAVGVYDEIDILNAEGKELIKNIVEKIKNPKVQEIEVPERFKGIMRDYQVTGYKWLKTLSELELGGILADDMGFGKTLQAISLLYSERGRGTSIVVAPSSLIYNWENEVKKFAPDMKILVIAGDRASRQEAAMNLKDYDLIVTSYPLIRRDISLYENYEFNYCILDEAQHIKNPESINARNVKKINAKKRFVLTGTPMENNLLELWSIFDFLMPGFLFSKGKFLERFERPIVKSEDKIVLSELKKMISYFVLRRKKKDVLKELPDKIETKIMCEMTKEQEKIYRAYVLKAREDIQKLIGEEGFDRSRIEIISILTRLRQICCHPGMFVENYDGTSGKIEALEELIDELIEGEHRILLFSQFTSLLSIIKDMLERKNIKYMYLDGQTKVKDRIELVNRFNAGEGSIFLISLKAGGTGLNLTSADTVIHVDPWWNPAVEDQATDRAHRIGQKNAVQVFKLISKGTIEEKIVELQDRKKELINAVVQDGEAFISKLSEEEIMELFMGDIHLIS